MTAHQRYFSRIEIDERARIARLAWERQERPVTVEFVAGRILLAGNVREMLRRLTEAFNGSAPRNSR